VTSAILAYRGSNGAPKPSSELAWRGRTIRDEQGETIGKIEEIYVADETGAPDWALVRGDGPSAAASFLPLRGSRNEGEEVVVPFTKTQFAQAPRTHEAGRLSPEQGAALYDHYGINEFDRRPADVRLDGAGQTMVAGEQRLASRPNVRFWLRLLSDMRGRTRSS
jgi:hypothetical protein